MTIEEAIHVMESIVYMIKPHYNKDIIEEAVELAIQALEQQPSDDCISRQAVIRLVEQYPNIIGNRCSGLIADIKHLPSVTPRTNLAETSQDCISRQVVLDEINRIGDTAFDSYNDYSEFFDFIDKLPPVTPQRPKGKWIDVLEYRNEFGSAWHYECSECRAKSYKGFEPLEKYCPNCGADMKEEQNDE